ncbi:hypothetical protein CC78DRAFT_538304 [Lojkania enalia]|uniref:Transcription initiation factor TFIID subunit 8 n=1 Tax=Lojkania enalia TaxID=147567 RepID=A0A9P4JZA9_9PLEO|nr:hypothetical protein CC78DRAFT_538304 [Didymosphaeria enalia]
MPSDAGATPNLGMKRSHPGATAPSYGKPPLKKRKVVHKLHHTQPIHNVREPISAELDQNGEYKDFFDHQLRRAIAMECKGIGFDGARPEALQGFAGLVDEYMRQFLARVRKSMSSARRTSTVPHDWIYALTSTGITGSSSLEQHLDTGEIPAQFLQPFFKAPEPADEPPPDLEGMIGPELSGKKDKEDKKWIPKHFPPFPSKHTWKSTPVFTERESDPRKIREKAAEEGILAEQSLRKLMAAQKAGLQDNKAKKTRQSKRMKESDKLWKAAMESCIEEEEARAERERNRFGDEEEEILPLSQKRNLNLEETVHVNYERKFWRKSAT